MANRVYLDHAATTPMLDTALEAWVGKSRNLGNPSSLHASGRSARRIVEESRESIAADLGVRPSAVIFTSGGTESDNLAVKGLFWKRREQISGTPVVIASPIEHHAVLDPLNWLAEHEGAEIRWLPVDSLGRVSAADVESAIVEAGGRAALVTVMWANNEIGTVQPIHEIAAMCRAAGVPFHTDAVQVVGALPLDLAGIDAVTITGHKIGGPFGVGALIAETNLDLVPVQHGGGQEREVRSGTLDAPGIAAFAVAVHHAVTEQRATAERLRSLRERMISGVRAAVPSAVLNGDPVDRLPGNAHFSFPGCEGDALLMLLDAAGVDVSTGSACSAGIPEPSHVLLAMGVDEPTARGSLRFSLGRTSTEADVEFLLEALPGAVERASRAGSAARR